MWPSLCNRWWAKIFSYLSRADPYLGGVCSLYLQIPFCTKNHFFVENGLWENGLNTNESWTPAPLPPPVSLLLLSSEWTGVCRLPWGGGVSFGSPASAGPNLYRQGCRWLLGLPQPQLGWCAGASYGGGEGSVASAIQCAARMNVAGLDDLYEPPVSASFLA